LNPPKALVLGCTGQDGSLVSQSLLEQGYEVTGTSRSNNRKIESHEKLGISKKIKVVSTQLLKAYELEKLINLENPNEIYNFAGQSSVGLSFKYPRETRESIVTITKNLLNTCKALKFEGRLFFAGSSEIFGNTSKPASVDSEKNPMSPYAEAKMESLFLVKKFREEYNLKCATGIFFNHESNLRSKRFVTQKIVSTAKKIANGCNEKLKLGNINIVRDWGSARDYILAAQKMIRSKKLKDYTICTGKSVNLEYFLNNVFEQLHMKWEDHVIIDKTLFRPNDIDHSFGDCSEIYKDLGWKATKNIDSIVNELLED